MVSNQVPYVVDRFADSDPSRRLLYISAGPGLNSELFLIWIWFFSAHGTGPSTFIAISEKRVVTIGSR